MVADVDQTRGRDERQKVAAPIGRQKQILLPSLLGLIMLVLVASGNAATADADESTGRLWSARFNPTVRWFTWRGLDPSHNALDAVVKIGVPCPEYRRIWPGDCPTEFFLTEFLERLPPDLTVIEDKLRSFGALCRKSGQQLTCIYRKHETYKQQLTNERITEEVYYYTAKLNIAERNGKLTYSTSFDRKVVKLQDNEPPNRGARALGRTRPHRRAIRRGNE